MKSIKILSLLLVVFFVASCDNKDEDGYAYFKPKFILGVSFNTADAEAANVVMNPYLVLGHGASRAKTEKEEDLTTVNVNYLSGIEDGNWLVMLGIYQLIENDEGNLQQAVLDKDHAPINFKVFAIGEDDVTVILYAGSTDELIKNESGDYITMKLPVATLTTVDNIGIKGPHPEPGYPSRYTSLINPINGFNFETGLFEEVVSDGNDAYTLKAYIRDKNWLPVPDQTVTFEVVAINDAPVSETAEFVDDSINEIGTCVTDAIGQCTVDLVNTISEEVGVLGKINGGIIRFLIYKKYKDVSFLEFIDEDL